MTALYAGWVFARGCERTAADDYEKIRAPEVYFQQEIFGALII